MAEGRLQPGGLNENHPSRCMQGFATSIVVHAAGLCAGSAIPGMNPGAIDNVFSASTPLSIRICETCRQADLRELLQSAESAQFAYICEKGFLRELLKAGAAAALL